MSDSLPVPNKAREFAVRVREIVVNEWRSRTAYGKLWFPVWFVRSLFIWLIVLSILIPVAAFAHAVRLFEESSREELSLTPDVYRGDD
jgi:hypothetical protein